MSSFNIQWSATSLENLDRERYAQFFAIVHGGELLYVGKGYRETLALVIPACIQQLELDHLGLTLFLGRVQEVGSGQISSASIDAMLELLVFARKPRFNSAGKFSYQGQDDLSLAMAGCMLMPGKLRAENKMVFVGKPASSTLSNPIYAC